MTDRFTYKTMADVRAANRAIGHHWFSRDTMRFFNSRVEGGLFANRYFITSEQYIRMDGTQEKRAYTVRVAMPDGQIETHGEFMAHRTREDAKAEILRIKALRTCSTCGEDAPHFRTDHNYTLA